MFFWFNVICKFVLIKDISCVMRWEFWLIEDKLEFVSEL